MRKEMICLKELLSETRRTIEITKEQLTDLKSYVYMEYLYLFYVYIIIIIIHLPCFTTLFASNLETHHSSDDGIIIALNCQ